MTQNEFLFQMYLHSESQLNLDSDMKMTLDEADLIVDERLMETNMKLSAIETKADGMLLIR